MLNTFLAILCFLLKELPQRFDSISLQNRPDITYILMLFFLGIFLETPA